MTESLSKVEKELGTVTLTLERREKEISMLKKVIKEEENKENLLQDRLNQAQKTITKHEENLMNLRLKEEDMKVIIHNSDLSKSECMFKQAFYFCISANFHGNSRFHSYLRNNSSPQRDYKNRINPFFPIQNPQHLF